MEDEERQRKVQLGKEKFAKLRGRKKGEQDRGAPDGSSTHAVRKKRKKDSLVVEGGAVSTENASLSSTSTSCTDEMSKTEAETISSLPCNNAVIIESGEPGVAELEVPPWSPLSNDVFDPLIDEDRELISTSSDLDVPIASMPKEPSVSPRDSDLNIKIEECNQKLNEYQSALFKRDALIAQLTERLQITIKQRDQYREEGVSQADDLASEMNILKLQLQKANEFLQNQKGKNGISPSELLEAQNQVIMLQQTGIQKDATLQGLAQVTTELKKRIAESEALLAIERSESESRLRLVDEQLSVLRSDNEVLRRRSEEITANLRQIEVENEELRSKTEALGSELLSLRGEREALTIELQTREDRIALIQSEVRLEQEELQRQVTLAKDDLKGNRLQTSNEIKQLMEQLEEQQQKAAYECAEAKQVELHFERQLAEADERHGNQIVQMKESVRAQFVEQLEQLKRRLAEVETERDRMVTATVPTTVLNVDLTNVGEGDSVPPPPPLSPNTSFLSSASDAWTDKLREVISEKEALETGLRVQLSQLQQQLIEADDNLRSVEAERAKMMVELSKRSDEIEAAEAARGEAQSIAEHQSSQLAALQIESALKYGELRSSFDQLMSDLAVARTSSDAAHQEKDTLQRQMADDRLRLLELCKEREEAMAEWSRDTDETDCEVVMNFVDLVRQLRHLESEHASFKDAERSAEMMRRDEDQQWKEKYEAVLEEKLELEMKLGEVDMLASDGHHDNPPSVLPAGSLVNQQLTETGIPFSSRNRDESLTELRGLQVANASLAFELAQRNERIAELENHLTDARTELVSTSQTVDRLEAQLIQLKMQSEDSMHRPEMAQLVSERERRDIVVRQAFLSGDNEFEGTGDAARPVHDVVEIVVPPSATRTESVVISVEEPAGAGHLRAEVNRLRRLLDEEREARLALEETVGELEAELERKRTELRAMALKLEGGVGIGGGGGGDDLSTVAAAVDAMERSAIVVHRGFVCGDRDDSPGYPVTESGVSGEDVVPSPAFAEWEDDGPTLEIEISGGVQGCLRDEVAASQLLESSSDFDVEVKADSIPCECQRNSLAGAPVTDASDVWAPYRCFEDLIEAAAQATSGAALLKARHAAPQPEDGQHTTDASADNLDSHRRFLSDHLARLRSHVELQVTRRLTGNAGEKLEVERERQAVLRELDDLKSVLRDMEARLQAAELSDEAGRRSLEQERMLHEETLRSLEKQHKIDVSSLRQELQSQYDEDVEHVRNVMEESFVQEAQADMETQVEFLRDKLEADIHARNEENGRLCAELEELKVQILQLQRDKCRLERYLCQDGNVILEQIDDLDTERAIAADETSSPLTLKDHSCSREDLRTTNTSLRQTIANLIGIYVDVAKLINKEMVTLFGTELEETSEHTSENPNASDRIDRFSSMAAMFQLDTSDVRFNETADTSTTESNYPSLPPTPAPGLCDDTATAADRVSDNPELDPVLGEVANKVGAKLSATVERLLGMLSALLQHLQESRFAQDEWTNTSLQTDDELAVLATQREELAAQLKAETQTRECVAGELHKVTGLLKAAEAEKAALEDTLARKEVQLSKFICQMDELEAQNQRLEDCLAEDHLSMDNHREIVAEGLGEQAQMVKHAPRTEPSQTQPALATGEQELLEENTRLMREKRGLQHRGEKDRNQLMARVQELEQTLDESASAHEKLLETKLTEITDLIQQIDALEKQLRGYKQFIEEQTAEREQEREDFQIEVNKLNEIVRDKERAQSGEEQLFREVEALTEKVKQKERLCNQAVSKRELLERDVEALTDKSKTQQDTIRELERQLDCKSRNERDLGTQMDELKVALTNTSKAHNDQQNEIEELRKMSISSQMSTSLHFMDDYISIRGVDMDVPPTPESILLELRSQVHHLEDQVSRHVKDLEGLHVSSSSVSSPCSEEVSVREQLDVLRHIGRGSGSTSVNSSAPVQNQRSDSLDPSFSAYIRDVHRLEDKVDTLTRSRDVVLKMLKDYEVQLIKQKHIEEELIQDRDVLQQQLNTQLLQISGLQARIEDRRLGLHGVEILEKMTLVQEELDKRTEEVEKKTHQISELQEDLARVQLQCTNFKTQVNELRQRYSDDVAQNKTALSKADAKVNNLEAQNRALNEDLAKSEKQFEEISSLLQTLMKEKNDEMDNLNSQLLQAESEKEHLLGLEKEQAEKWQALSKEVEEQKLKLASLEDSLREKEETVISGEKETRRALDMVEQKRREVDALKIVLKEKAQLVEQVEMLQAELYNLSQYQARLQEDFETVRLMLEDRQNELSLVQHELTEVQTVRDASIEEKVLMKNELDRLQDLEAKRSSRTDAEVQCDDDGHNLTKLNQAETMLEVAVAERLDAEHRFSVLEESKANVDRRLTEVTGELANARIEWETSRAELVSERERLESELTLAAQGTERLEAEIAWRDTKIYRLEDEMQQVLLMAASADDRAPSTATAPFGEGDDEKTSSVQKFLEDMSHDVLQELLNRNSDEDNRGGDGEFGPTSGLQNGNSVDGNSTEVSCSDAESVSSSIRDASPTLQVRTLVRRIYKEGINVLNLSELQAIEEHVARSEHDPSASKGASPTKTWERERLLLVTEVKALKELLSQMTAIVSASKQNQASRDPVSAHVNSLLQFVSNLLSMERETLLAQIKLQLTRRGEAEVGVLNNTVSKLNAVYSELLDNISKIRASFGQSADSDGTDEWSSSVQTNGSEAGDAQPNVHWEVQMAVARERLENQTKHKQLLRQLHAADQQMMQCERQSKRRMELMEFRVQQERIICEDVSRSLDMEKTRNIEMCSQLALEKNRASHLTLTNVQLKSELAKCQLSFDQERQELRNITQLFRNEKLQTETLVAALQSEQNNFGQLQEAIEAEKRRNKTSYARQQQIIEELRQTLDHERQLHAEQSSILERERQVVQSAQREVSRWQQQQQQHRNQTPTGTPRRGSGGNGSLCSNPDDCGDAGANVDDIREALELERRKSQDLGAILQKEHVRVSSLMSSMQQERRHLLEELESEQNVTSLLQSKTDTLLIQKNKLQKDVQQGRELINRLEIDYDKACCELATTRERLHQREQEVEALHRMQRDVQKEWEVGREQDRQHQLDLQMESQRLQQKLVILEKELEFARQSELQLQRDLTDDGRYVVGRNDNYPSSASLGTGSRFQQTGLETIRQRLYLLLLKTRDEMDGIPPAKKSKKSTSVSIANTVGALLTELRSMGNEAGVMSHGSSDNLSHLGLVERIVRHNADLADFAARISEEKLELRKQLLSQSREAAATRTAAPRSASAEHLLGAERAAWAQERAGLQMSLHRAEADLMRTTLGGLSASSRRSGLNSATTASARNDELRAAHYYQKFLRAEKFRKNLAYQKNYLKLMLCRYQDTEEATVDMLGRLGCLTGDPAERDALSRAPLRRFRRAVCVVVAVVRMRLLVRQWLAQQEQRQSAVSAGRSQRMDAFDANSIVTTPSLYSSRNHPSYLGCTPPVRDTNRPYSNVSGSDRSISPVIHCSGSRSIKTASSGSSHSSPSPSTTRLSDYVHRFEVLQQQLGIGLNNPGTLTPPPVM